MGEPKRHDQRNSNRHRKERREAKKRGSGNPQRSQRNPEVKDAIELRLQELETTKYQGATVRARVQQEERRILTKDFFNKRTKYAKNKNNNRNNKDRRNNTTNKEEIKKEFHIFYKNLYKEKNKSDNINKTNLRRFCKKLTDEQKNETDE